MAFGQRGASSALVDGLFLDDPGPPMSEWFEYQCSAWNETGMSASEAKELGQATHNVVRRVRARLQAAGKLAWLNGIAGSDPFRQLQVPVQFASGTGVGSCQAFYRQRCVNESHFLGGETLGVATMAKYPQSLVQGNWRQQIATLLLLRGQRAFIVASQWFATNVTTRMPWDNELLERDYGQPETECVESEAGVFERRWSAGVVSVDCNELVFQLPGDPVESTRRRLKNDDDVDDGFGDYGVIKTDEFHESKLPGDVPNSLPSWRLVEPELLGHSHSNATAPPHFWFANGGFAVGSTSIMVQPLRWTCDTPCFNASSSFTHQLLYSRASGSVWSSLELLKMGDLEHKVPTFTTHFVRTPSETITLQPHRDTDGVPKRSFTGHATQWAASRAASPPISFSYIAGGTTYTLGSHCPWNITTLIGCGNIIEDRFSGSRLLQSIAFAELEHGDDAWGVALFDSASADGLTWQHQATIVPPGQSTMLPRGAGENSIAQLRNGSILCVIRSGTGFHQHDGLVAVLSTDSSGTAWFPPWSLRPQDVWGVRPNLLWLPPAGPMLLMSGRPGLLLWQSRDGVNWQIALNIAKAHNEAVDRELRFQQAFVEAEVQGLTEVGSTAYTSLLLRGTNKSTAVVVCYDRLAHGWYGNSNASVNLSGTDLIFCARLQNFTAIEDSSAIEG